MGHGEGEEAMGVRAMSPVEGGSGTLLRTRAAFAVMTLAATLASVLPMAPAAASVDPAAAEAGTHDVRETTRAVARPGSGHLTSTGFWAWSEGGLGYFLTGTNSSTIHGAGYPTIVATDLDSGEVVATNTGLSPTAYASPGDSYSGGTDRSIEIDEKGGRLFVATQSPLAPGDPNSVCQHGANGGAHVCFSGVTELDARTLAFRKHIPVRKLRADGSQLGSELMRMSYAPATAERAAKLLLLVQDGVTDASVLPHTDLRTHSAVTMYLMQLDLDSGAEDWTIRLDQCRGALSSNGSDRNTLQALRHQATVFRRDTPEPAVYVGCHFVTQSYQGGVVKVPLDDNDMPAGLVPVPGPPQPPEPPQQPPSGPPRGPADSGPAPRINSVGGPDRVYEILGDRETGRILLQVLDGKPLAQVWWVFDTHTMRFTGTVGVGGPVQHGGTLAAVDRGRLYLLTHPEQGSGRSFAGGLFVADIARTPVAQALIYPELADRFPAGELSKTTPDRWSLTVQRLPDGARRLWHPTALKASELTQYKAIEDHRPDVVVSDSDPYAGRSLDLEEAEGVTSVALDGAARGYGLRAVLVGGIEAMARVGPADPIGSVDECGDAEWSTQPGIAVENTYDSGANNVRMRPQSEPVRPFLPEEIYSDERKEGGPCYYAGIPLGSPCTRGDREVVIAAVGPEGPAIVDGTGARGAADPLRIDTMTAADTENAVSRCAGQDWDQIWATALFGSAPIDEPKAASLDEVAVECISGKPADSESTGDPVSDGFSAAVKCGDAEASGHAYARGFAVDGFNVAEALSTFRIYRDPGRGIVSRVESVARGLDIGGVLRIDTVRGVAESWANGRNQPVPSDAQDPGYRANCDMERSAGTCFQRHLFGLKTPGYACGPCGDEAAFVDAVDAALGPLGGSVRLREPDPNLRVGSENGFIAAVQKPEVDRFGDLVLNTDLLQTVLPTLEIIRQAPPNRYFSRLGARGRQIYQFAGVEVSSSYGISCLLVYDEATNTCAEPAEAPGSIQVSLSDTDGKPLAGGAFELREDVDADGVLGLKDTLLPGGACVTAEDGIGTCLFDNLQPGTYLVSQVAAPPGYAKSAEPWVSEVASGEQRTVAFTNVSNVSTIDLKATDENGAPLNGATFAAYPDPDSDGKVAPDAKPAAECTTDAQGVCTMKVPAGSYVLVQTGAPGGLEGIEPVPFTFASGGQVASVTVVNYPPAAPEQPAAAAAPIDYTPPVDYAPPVESVADFTPVAETPVIEEPTVSVPERIGGTVTQVIRAPGDALRLLARDPKQAAAWTAALALFCLAAMAVRRRSLLTALGQGNR